MLAFCGTDRCLIDTNGRLKFSPRVLAGFAEKGSQAVVIHCLPEGALAVYPESVFEKIRSQTVASADGADNLAYRRRLRRFGAMSSPETISAQGRITLPPGFRDHAALKAGCEAVVAGCEMYVEIWNRERWDAEGDAIQSHALTKGELEMEADLPVIQKGTGEI